MIIDKHQAPKKDETVQDPVVQEPVKTELQEAVDSNAMIDAYKAVRAILETLHVNPNDPTSPRLFKTIKLDNGQLSRIKNNKHNLEYGFAFPAVFIHFVDVYYNLGTSRIAEGKGTMRIHYILNRLNNSDDDFETEGLKVYKQIVEAIESNKSSFPALVSRFQLQYWDMPLTFDDGVQPYWIDYQIWFNEYASYRYKDYVDTYIVQPPFTQHSDQNEEANPDHLEDDKITKYDDVSGFVNQI